MTKFTVLENPDISNKVREMPLVKPFTQKDLDRLGIIHPAMKEQSVVNSFRQLRTSLRSKMNRFNSSLIVSSVKSGGGASFTAINLAAAFTLEQQRTAMLIDCNLNDPVLAERLEVEAEHGLKNYLNGEVDDISEIVYQTGVPRLHLLPGGHAESDFVEYFSGDRMVSLLDAIKNKYPERFIILDAPPVEVSADTKILSELCDYILLVVPYKGTTSGAINKTLTALDRSKVIGMVMNK